MLNVGQIEEGFVLDHIQAGKSLAIYHLLQLDKLDYTRHPYSKMIRQVSVYDYHPDIPKDESLEVPIMPEEKPTKKKKSNLYGSASPPTDF